MVTYKKRHRGILSRKKGSQEAVGVLDEESEKARGYQVRVHDSQVKESMSREHPKNAIAGSTR